jgi:hypothetical protein
VAWNRGQSHFDWKEIEMPVNLERHRSPKTGAYWFREIQRDDADEEMDAVAQRAATFFAQDVGIPVPGIQWFVPAHWEIAEKEHPQETPDRQYCKDAWFCDWKDILGCTPFDFEKRCILSAVYQLCPIDRHDRSRDASELHVCVQVHLSGLGRLMAKPESDHTQIHAAAEHRHSCAVPEGMWCHCFGRQGATALACRGNVPRNKLLQAIGAEAPAVGTREDRIFWLSALL